MEDTLNLSSQELFKHLDFETPVNLDIGVKINTKKNSELCSSEKNGKKLLVQRNV